MKRITLLLPLLLLIFFACNKNKNQITLAATNINGEVPVLGNLTFTFNEAVAPDSILQYWDETNYINFKPEIKGKYRWISSNELSFSPESSLLPATNYSAEFTNEITKINQSYNSIEDNEFEFHTALAQVENSDLYWYIKEDNTRGVKLELFFNYKVDVNDVEDALKVSLNEENKKVELLNNGEAYTAIFEILNVEALDEDYIIDFTLEEGLKPINGTNKTSTVIKKSKLLKSPFKIEVTGIEANHSGVGGIVTVKTTQGVKSTDLKDFISISPQVKFTVNSLTNTIEIKSEDFDVSTKYEISIKKGLKGTVGGELKANYSADITFGELEPSIEFEHSKGMYLSALGSKNIAIRIVNIPEVTVKIYKLYESNLLTASTGNDYYYSSYSGDLLKQDLIFEKNYTTADFKKMGNASLLNLNFKDELKEFDGIYYVSVQSNEDYWLKDGKYISMSDIGIIAKQGQNKVSVFVNSIKTAESLAGVKLRLIGRNNQLISEGITAADGSAQLILKNNNYSGFEPALITAEKNGDFTMMNLQDAQVHTSRFEVGGYRDLPNGLQTFIYLERNLYRPGEEINYAAIIRNQNWASPGKLPVKVEVLTPTGKKLVTTKKSLNDEGSFDGSFSVDGSAVTGFYTIYIYSSTDVLLASKNVMVEEFMPDRIKVSTSLTNETLTVQNPKTEINVVAQNLFGPPAANRNYQMEISYRKKYFSPKDYRDFNFYITNTDAYLGVDNREGKTDEVGKVNEKLEIPTAFKDMGLIQADVITTVFDETGRPVNRKNTLDVFTQDDFYGVGYFPYYLSTNSTIEIPLVVVDKDGKAQSNVNTKVQIIKHEYQTVLNKSGSYFRYESNKIEKIITEKTLTLNGKQNFKFTPTVSGRYEVRVYNPDVKGKYVNQSFYAYGYGRTYLSSFEVDNEGRIDIEMSKEEYEVGETATVLFKTPFQGKMLVTLEGKDVLEHFYVNTDKRSAEVSFEMTAAYLPNVYISATLIKSHQATEFPLTVAHGFQSVGVKDSKRETPIKITAVEESRSNKKQKISVKAAANSYVSIAVVDEGILQVGNFSTPDPYNYFYQKRALQVSSYDIYPYLLPEISSANSSGGDGGFDMSKRVNPFQNKRVKLVSYWSGLIKTNSNGVANYEIDIPQFSGSLRIMAVSHTGNKFGSDEKNITVADPIVISSSIPRFLSPGDTAYISSTLTNTTDKSTKAKSSISVSGPLKVVGQNTESISIANKKEGRVIYKVYTSDELGVGKITVNCNAFGETFKEETEISVRPAVPLVKTSESGSLQASKSVKFKADNADYIANSADYKLVVSKNPMVEFAKDLDYLVRYPYGCSEQTISAVFPQLYYKDLIESMYGKSDNSININYNIQAAISKLKMRQLYNGSINMWDNCECENWWVTAYAAHFLVEAKKAGFSVDEDFLQTNLGYLKNRLKSKETVNYYYSRNLNKKIAPKEVAYSLYVLALANQADISLMNYYKSNTALLANDAKYLLAAAYVLAGDKEKGKSILPNTFESDNAKSQFGGSFYSAVRDEAIALNALLDIDPNHKDIGVMTQHLSENLRRNKYLNTQERIFSLLALGKVAKQANASNIVATIKADGKQIGSYENGVVQFSTKQLAGKEIEITTSGSGRLFYYLEMEGIRKDGTFKEVDNHLQVRKTFYDRYGKEIKSNQFKQNDLVVVKLSIKTDYSGSVENVVITDMLPAGFEIENPRTDDVPGTQWIKNQAYANHKDIRDDRINIFDDIYHYNDGRSQDYYYVVRAVSPGVYKMGPVGADAMYNGEYHSYSGGGWIKIVE